MCCCAVRKAIATTASRSSWRDARSCGRCRRPPRCRHDRQEPDMAEVTGQPLSRIDGRLKVTGRAPYTAEHPVPHAAHGVLVMSTVAKGRITSIDTQAAERTPDVIAVLTHVNAPKLPDDPGPKGSTRSAARKLQLLQDDRIHYAN